MSKVLKRVHRLNGSYPLSANPKDRLDAWDRPPLVPSNTEAYTLSRIDLHASGMEEALHGGERVRDSPLLLVQKDNELLKHYQFWHPRRRYRRRLFLLNYHSLIIHFHCPELRVLRNPALTLSMIHRLRGDSPTSIFMAAVGVLLIALSGRPDVLESKEF
ncbi:hypothetical protein Zmor_023295 [Zophobas morio]|uniref:Uncharacterized protein n=1 Tax=Zophobas morio TaxID=2755281 RepID=A0AA38M788_9CUCU|nr:hypothetical protein Zmor_023295 [Zophobas morio]